MKLLTRGRSIERICLSILIIALIALSYLIGAGGLQAALPNCTDCDCKMAYAWKAPADSVAFGMKNLANPAQPVQNALALQVAPGSCDATKPKPCFVNDKGQLYQYTQFNPLCIDQPNSRLSMEVEPVGTGSQFGGQTNLSQCYANGVPCPIIIQ